jgi:hypothetical protein
VGQEEEDKKTILAKLNELEKNGNYMLKWCQDRKVEWQEEQEMVNEGSRPVAITRY